MLYIFLALLSDFIFSESLIPQRLFDDGEELVFVADMLPDEFSRVLWSRTRYVFVTCERLRPEFALMIKQYIEVAMCNFRSVS